MSELIPAEYIDLVVKGSYFLAAFLFIFGLKQMSSPVTARGGIVWAGAAMVLATLVTFLHPGMENYVLMMLAIGLASILAWWSGKRVAMTDMPQMVALYNGMGGGSAAAIAAQELLGGGVHSLTFLVPYSLFLLHSSRSDTSPTSGTTTTPPPESPLPPSRQRGPSARSAPRPPRKRPPP